MSLSLPRPFDPSPWKGLLQLSICFCLTIAGAAEASTHDARHSYSHAPKQRFAILEPPVSPAGSAATSPGYCTADGNKFKFLPQFEPQDPPGYIPWIKAAVPMSKEFETAREAFLSRGDGFDVVKAALSSSEQSFFALRDQVETVLTGVPASQRNNGQRLLQIYFKMAGIRAELEQIAQPTRYGIEDLRARYAIYLNPVVEGRFFAYGVEHLNSLSVDPIMRNGRRYYRLSPSGETVFNSLVRAAARSPLLSFPQQRYITTVRCLLARAVTAKLATNSAVLNRGEPTFPIGPNESVCLGVKFDEIAELSKRENKIISESLLRSTFLKGVPPGLKYFSTESQEFILKNNIAEELPLLLAFPASLADINEDRKNSNQPEVSAVGLDKTIKDADAAINRAYAQVPGWSKTFAGPWNDSNLQARVRSLFDSCGMPITDVDGAELARRLNRADNLSFLALIIANIKSLPGELMSMDGAAAASVLGQYLIDQRVEASLRTFSFVLNQYYVKAKAPSSEEVFLVGYDELTPILRKQFTEAWLSTPELKDWLSKLVAQIQAEKTNAQNFNALRANLQTKLFSVSQEVARRMDPTTDPNTLPYDEDSVLLALGTGAVNMLSPEAHKYFVLIRDSKNPEDRNRYWQLSKGAIVGRLAEVGVTCSSGSGFGNAWLQWTSHLFTSQDDRLKASQDCTILTLFANAIGADQTGRLENLAHTVNAIRTLQDESHLQSFLKEYRKRIAALASDKNRIVDFPLKSSRSLGVKVPLVEDEKYWQKMLRVKDPQLMDADLNSALSASVSQLSSFLDMAVHAKNENDLAFFIKRTMTINSVLGDWYINHKDIYAKLKYGVDGTNYSSVAANDTLGFIFPALLAYQEKIQSKMALDETYNKEMWTEFVDYTALYPIEVVVGGWAARGIFARTFTERMIGPAVAWFIDKIGTRTSDIIMSHMDYVLGVFLVDFGALTNEIWDLNAELANLDSARLAEGVGIAVPGGAYPLISHFDYMQAKLLLSQRKAEAWSAVEQTVVWTSLSVVMGRGGEYLAEKMRAFRMNRDIRYQNYGRVGRAWTRYFANQGLSAKMNTLKIDQMILGNPGYDIGLLREAWANKRLATPPGIGRRRLDESYLRIVYSIGNDLERIADMPEMQQIYAEKLFGGRGNINGIEEFYYEYKHLVGNGGKL